MSVDDTRWADQLLDRARATAAPRREDAARNLASIEARLGIGPGLAHGSAPGVAPRAAPDIALRARALPGAWMKGAFVKAGLVLAFGAGTGFIGYLLGRAETERSPAPIADSAAAALPAMPEGQAREVVAREAIPEA